MSDANGVDSYMSETLESREPSVEDLVELCRHLNDVGARYIVIGGFAMRAAGYDRHTMDIDLLIDANLENEAKVYEALAYLPDQAVHELRPGELTKYTVIRVADEIVVDLMKSAGGIEYTVAIEQVILREVDGVTIPFASPRLLWEMKHSTYRDKDVPDLHFLKLLFERSRG
jgi:hypothetical protein